MPIDPLAPDLLSLAAAARTFPRLRADRPVSPATLWRWAAHGLRGIRLEIVRVGGTACTTPTALRKFLAAVEEARRTSDTAGPSPAPKGPTAAERANAALSAAGI